MNLKLKLFYQNRIINFVTYFFMVYAPFYLILGAVTPGGILEIDIPETFILPFDVLRQSYQKIIHTLLEFFSMDCFSVGNYVYVMGKKVISINNSCLGLNYFSFATAFSIVFLKNCSVIQVVSYLLLIYILNVIRFIILIVCQLNHILFTLIDHHYIFDAIMLLIFLIIWRRQSLKNELYPILKIERK